MGLTLSRYPGQTILIGEDIRVTITRVQGEQVRINISAPRDMEIDREEVRKRKEEHKLEWYQ